MTDPRIKAAARELKRLFSEGDTDDAMWLSCAKCVLDAADAVDWRPIESAPADKAIIIGHPEYSLPGYKDDVAATEEWDGLFFEDANQEQPLSPQPTHWQPLPKPPETP